MNVASQSVSRLLVIGLDGATFDLLVPWSESGYMPNLARLMATSARAVVNSTRPYITPVAWTTFQTGCDPHEHGILDYRYLDHRHRRLLLNHAGRIRRPTLFDAVSAAGGQVVSLNLPMTFPAPSSVRGIVVGGLDSPSIDAALAPFPEFARRLRATGAHFDLGTVWRRKPTTFDELSAGIDQTSAIFRGQAVAADVADRMTDWQLMVVQLQVLDALQHRCWQWLDPREGCTAELWLSKARQALRALDDCLGELMELAARRGAAVVAVSDHGFGPFRGKITLAEILARSGLLCWPRGGAAAGYYLRHGVWRLRKFLYRRLKPGASTAQLTRPLDTLLPIDWKRSAAVALHGNLGALIYLNTQERFATGPLKTARQRDAALADAIDAFQTATHPETGEPLFVEVFGTAERFDVDPLERSWPDVVAIPAAGFHTRHKFDAQPQLVRHDPAMAATHRLEGTLLLHAPRVAAGTYRPAELRDVAPTILQMLGLRVPAQMTGKPLDDILRASAGVARTGPEAAHRGLQLAGITDADQVCVEARLRDLGYLD
ncbi:MAG TPA: alkaline phosphatase family protein [Pirellulales bacterium]|jgi:predicted AlkP superfamily phosphohydrolase/phosphomutase|nr:alkaline phosphatase family protein [Pirellulales bacterium]